MTGVILAGGKSSRFGHDKALQTIGDRTLIQWVVDRLSVLVTEIIIVTARGEEIPSRSVVNLRTVADIYADRGPLVGIYSGLMASVYPYSIVVGCDTPFLNVDLLAYMTLISSEFDAVVPRTGDKVEPLCAVYSRSCLAPIERLMQDNSLKVNNLYETVRVRYVGEDEIDRYDPGRLSFFNINTRTDLIVAREMMVGGGLDKPDPRTVQA
jgi:molybdenum cofactor guanylyltransferase